MALILLGLVLRPAEARAETQIIIQQECLNAFQDGVGSVHGKVGRSFRRSHSLLTLTSEDLAGAAMLKVGVERAHVELEGDCIVASADGSRITVADFLAFLTDVRHPGYQPATKSEAVRLVKLLIRQRLLEQAAIARGFSTDEAGLANALAQIVSERGRAPIDHDERERPQTRDAISSRQNLQRQAALDDLLKHAQVEIDEICLEEFVKPIDTVPGPPRLPESDGAQR